MLSRIIERKNNKMLEFVCRIICKTKINPNYVTLSAIVFSLIAGYYIVLNQYGIALIFMIITGLADIIDGGIARIQKKVTLFGNYLDAMTDRYVEIIIYSGFAVAGYSLPAFFAISGSLIITYAKARLAIIIPIDNHVWPAIGERADRFILLLIGTISYILYPMIYGYNTINITLWAVAIIANLGALERMKYANRLIEKYKYKNQKNIL